MWVVVGFGVSRSNIWSVGYKLGVRHNQGVMWGTGLCYLIFPAKGYQSGHYSNKPPPDLTSKTKSDTYVLYTPILFSSHDFDVNPKPFTHFSLESFSSLPSSLLLPNPIRSFPPFPPSPLPQGYGRELL